MDVFHHQELSFAHKNYQRALRGVFKIFVYLLDFPEDMEGLGHLPAAERKKERAKLKKRKDKERKEFEEKEKEIQRLEEEERTRKLLNSNEELEKVEKRDMDPLGDLLLQKDFLSEAAQWIKYDVLYLYDNEALALIADMDIRRGKFVQALRTLTLGLSRDSSSPDLVVVLVKLAMKVKGKKLGAIHAMIAQIVKEEVAVLLGGEVNEFVQQYFLKASSLWQSLPHKIAAFKCLCLLDNYNKSGSAVKVAESLQDEQIFKGRGANYANLVSLIQVRPTRLDLSSTGLALHLNNGGNVFPSHCF